MLQPEWLWGLAGGGLIGLAGAMFLLVNGRVMGISGIFGGLIDGSGRKTTAESAAFVAGLVLVPAAYALVRQGFATQVSTELWVLLTGGFLVGLGTRLANGCTSGHGVCGISRLSRRGIAATVVYVGVGVLVISVLRHVWGVL